MFGVWPLVAGHSRLARSSRRRDAARMAHARLQAPVGGRAEATTASTFRFDATAFVCLKCLHKQGMRRSSWKD